MTTEFPVKAIKWSVYEQVSPILLQVSNGPCPLIALVNTLLLEEDIRQRSESPRDPAELGGLRQLLNGHVGGVVPCPDVIAALGDILLATPDVDQAVLDTLLNSLPLLHTGLDVNPNLVHGSVQDSDLAAQVFSAFGLRFVHGWCISPEDNKDVYSVLSQHQDFNSIQDYLLSHDGSPTSQSIQTWLRENSTQLTGHGLQLMHQRLPEDTVSIFFRNNHFSTLYKSSNDFYLLLTDGSFDRSAGYVWQSLTGISGRSDEFYSGDFEPIEESTDVPSERYEHGENNDLLLVSRIQEEEDSNYAALLQKKYDQRDRRSRQSVQSTTSAQPPNTSDQTNETSKKSRAKKSSNSKDSSSKDLRAKKSSKSKGGCVMV